MAGASADDPMSEAQVAAGTAREALAAAVRRSLTRPGSVPPAEQYRLITAERHAEQACAEGPGSTHHRAAGVIPPVRERYPTETLPRRRGTSTAGRAPVR